MHRGPPVSRRKLNDGAHGVTRPTRLKKIIRDIRESIRWVGEIEGKAATGSGERVGTGASFKSAVLKDFSSFLKRSGFFSFVRGNELKTNDMKPRILFLFHAALRSDRERPKGSRTRGNNHRNEHQ